MVDIKGTMDAGKNSLERLVANIPGYKGYKDKEMRRDADKLLRMHIARQFDEQRRRMSDLQMQLVSTGQLELLDDLDRALQKLQMLIDRIKTASYGYAGFFDAVKVKEPQLDALYDFDNSLLDHVAAVSKSIDELTAAMSTKQGVVEAIARAVTVAQDANYAFGHREEVLLGGSAPTTSI